MLSDNPNPDKYEEAISSKESKQWIEAMQREWLSLEQAETWNLIKEA
jgi:hypothetical protein